ncbi:hypothetical protein ZMTM_12770 [Methyloradius palustris]|uniref:SIR2-like domain-containing protein n=2 Tax=Methyloradius palustris TaxID=2778876 RepID=A0A8D5K0R9_9PROT|nr:hypothetical protein ZMTM_12770 [Methyloradius palustris]
MRNLVEIVGLGELLAAHGVHDGYEDFESLYDRLASENVKPELLRTLEHQLHAYFAGMQLPEEVTLYDLLLLSLREKDVIATFNWDPFLAQAFRRNRSIRRLPKILFLHGNVEVGACPEHRRSGFIEQRCSVCGNLMRPSNLLFPVKHKDYTADPFIHSEWEQLQQALQSAYLVTIFGYSAPITDVEARSLLLKNWMENPTRELAEIDIIDIRPREDIEQSWFDFFVRQHYGIFTNVRQTTSFHHPRRSCEAFAMATLQQDPWSENNFPPLLNLEYLHKWLLPLIKEEEAEMFTGKPCAKSEL